MVTWLDLRRAMRALSRAPAFAFVGIVSIGTGLGGTSLLFALLNAVALRPPPYRNSERLFEFSQTAAAGCDRACPDVASPLQVRDWMSAFNGSVSHALVRIEEAVVDRSEWRRVETVARVSDGFFQLLGTQPSYGRIPGVGQIPDGNAVVLGERLANEIFGESSLAVGARLRIDAQSRLVVAVMPRDFAYPSSSELWVLDPSIDAEASAAPSVTVIGRLAEGESRDALEQRFDVAVKRHAAAFEPDKPWRKGFLTPLRNDKGRERGLWILLAVSLLTSCAACLNLGALFATRVAGRQADWAIRVALGASPTEAAMPSIVEVVTVAVGGIASGLAIAVLGGPAATALIAERYGLRVVVALDTNVLIFTVILVGLVVVGVFVAPILAAFQLRPGTILRAGATGAAKSTRRFDFVVVTLQIAFAFVATISASVLSAAFLRTQTVALGYEASRIASASLQPQKGSDSAAIRLAAGELARQLSLMPGVAGAAVWSFRYPRAPGRPGIKGFEIQGAGDVPFSKFPLVENAVTSGFFSTFDLAPIRGRLFSTEEQANRGTAVVIVNEYGAKLWWHGVEPIGQQLRLRGGPWLTVVGVIPDAVVGTLALRMALASDLRWPSIYRPFFQGDGGRFEVAASRLGAPVDEFFARQMRRTVDAFQPLLVARDVQPLRQRLTVKAGYDRLAITGRLAGLLSALALGIAILGVYGVVDASVRRRLRDFGVRLALGAPRGHIAWLVIVHGVQLAIAGMALGALATYWASAALRTAVFGLAGITVGIVAIPTVIFGVTTLLASWMPARRAITIDPRTILRLDG
jgi:putative ABC transport system permease protein